jgi:hypothetical protein
MPIRIALLPLLLPLLACLALCRTPCLLGWYEIQQILLQALPQSTALHLGAEFDQ